MKKVLIVSCVFVQLFTQESDKTAESSPAVSAIVREGDGTKIIIISPEVATSSTVLQSMLEDVQQTGKTESAIDLSRFSLTAFTHLQQILKKKSFLKELSYQDLLDIILLYDFLNINKSVLSWHELIASLATYAHNYREGDLPSFIEEYVHTRTVNILTEYKKRYLLEKSLVSYTETPHMPNNIFIGTPSYAEAHDNAIRISAANECSIYKQGKKIDTIIHAEKIRQVAISADGNYAISGGFDNKAHLYDMQKQAIIHTIQHQDYVTCVAISADGRFVATGSHDRTVLIFDREQKTSFQLSGFVTSTIAVALSNDGRACAIGTQNGTIHVCTTDATDSDIVIKRSRPANLTAMAFTPDGALVAAAYEDGTVILSDINTKQEQIISLPDEDYIHSLSLIQAGSLLVIGTSDNIILYDTLTKKIITTIKLSDFTIESGISSHGRIIMTRSKDFEDEYSINNYHFYTFNTEALASKTLKELLLLYTEAFSAEKAPKETAASPAPQE